MIPMPQPHLDFGVLDDPKLRFCLGSKEQVRALPEQPALAIFAPQTLDFLDLFSALLLEAAKGEPGRRFPELSALAFFCRRRELERQARRYADGLIRRGRGLVFHSTPSNVPLNFAFSLIAGVLCGNTNLVRLPAVDSEAGQLVIKILSRCLERMPQFKERLVLVKYESAAQITALFSALCQCRVLWGGDKTIATMRQAPLPPRAHELSFADRHALCLMQATQVASASESELRTLVQGFFNDTYRLDQNACSSPKFMIWYGTAEQHEQAAGRFWAELHALLKEKNYELPAAQAVAKLTRLYEGAACCELKHIATEDNLIVRAEAARAVPALTECCGRCGLFYELRVDDLSQMLPWCGLKCQTLTYFGFERSELEHFLSSHAMPGVDRVVPVGHALDFDLVWDGYDLICELSRVVSVR